MNYLTEEEKQQLLFDWRYKGFSTIELLSEEECDELNEELEKLRNQRQKTTKKMVVNGQIMTHLCIHTNYQKNLKKYFLILKL